MIEGRKLGEGDEERMAGRRVFLQFSREFEQKEAPFAQKSCVFQRNPSPYSMTTF